MENEKKVVTIAVCVFVLSYIIVYMVFFSLDENILAKNDQDIQKTQQTENVDSPTKEDKLTKKENTTWEKKEKTNLIGQNMTGENIKTSTWEDENIKESEDMKEDEDKEKTKSKNEKENIRKKIIQEKMLKYTWVSLHTGEMELLDKFFENSFQNFLYENKAYISFLGGHSEEIVKQSIEDIGGKYVEFDKKNIIKDKHKLFGDKIIYANKDTWKEKKVIVFIWFEDKNEWWYFNIPYKEYYSFKKPLRQLFDKIYTK